MIKALPNNDFLRRTVRPLRVHVIAQFRYLSVKELTWCSPDSNAEDKRKKDWSSKSSQCFSCDKPAGASYFPEFRFGIIAAHQEKSRIIGLNGKLPWNVPEDRKYFKSVTSNKVLIIGKRTFHENTNLSHLEHLRRVIVISSSMKEKRFVNELGCQNVDIARSFEDALHLSAKLQVGKEKESHEDEIDCWIGGGQRIYEEALRHPNAAEIRLTYIHCEDDFDVDLSSSDCDVAFFPAKYRWDNTFKEVAQKRRYVEDNKSGLHCTFTVHRRRWTYGGSAGMS